MEKVVDFLLDYYVWILGVLGIAIITTIGVIADIKKKKNKSNENEKISEVKTTEPLPEVANTQNVLGTVDDNLNVNNNVGVNNLNENLQTNLNINSSLEPNDVSNSNNNNKLLSQQKPQIEPRNVVMQQQPIVNDNVIPAPKPVYATPINQPIQQQPVMQPSYGMQQANNYQNMQTTKPLGAQNGYYNNPSVGQTTMVMPQQNVSLQSQSFNSNMVNPNVGSVPNGNNLQGIPVQPQPVIPNLQQMQQPQVNEQKSDVTNTVGLNFVTSENNAPSQTDDTWQL